MKFSNLTAVRQVFVMIFFVLYHYENLPMQYTEIFIGVKNKNFQQKSFDIFLIFVQNIDCGYTLEPPRRGASNEYPQSMFWSRNKKNRYTPAYPSFSNIKVGFKGVDASRTCFPDASTCLCNFFNIVFPNLRLYHV